jgi:hypothetical protein
MRTLVAAVAAVLAIASVALAFPPATIEDVDRDSVTVGNLDCGTQYRIQVAERRSGTWRDNQVYTTTTAPCPDTTPPETTITDAPPGTTDAREASFQFTASEANSSFECRLDDGLWVVCASPRQFTGLAVGQHTFDVRARDAAGNFDGSPARHAWVVTEPPPPPPPAPPAGPDPATCTGYPEPRVAYESQQWWTQDSDLENPQPDDELNGRDEHTHIRVCLPAPGQVVSGTVRFDLMWMVHEMTDGYMKRVRIQPGGGPDVVKNTQAATQTRCAGLANCEGVETLLLDTSSFTAGRYEMRFHAESERTDDSGALATNGWHVCVRSCAQDVPFSSRAVRWPTIQGRGRWFETMLGAPDDYGYSQATIATGYPADQNGLTPQSGTWCPTLRTSGGSPAPPGGIVRSFVSVDPRWHDYSAPGYPNGYPGDVLIDQAGTINRQVCIDTTRYANGRHRLYVRADGQTPTGKSGGVQVVEFLVNN